jgi:hypothetical protein
MAGVQGKDMQRAVGKEITDHSKPREDMSERTAGEGARKPLQPRWCPARLSKTQRRRLHKLRKAEIEKDKEEKEHDEWFNAARPMTTPKMTWREKRLAWEERAPAKRPVAIQGMTT